MRVGGGLAKLGRMEAEQEMKGARNMGEEEKRNGKQVAEKSEKHLGEKLK